MARFRWQRPLPRGRHCSLPSGQAQARPFAECWAPVLTYPKKAVGSLRGGNKTAGGQIHQKDKRGNERRTLSSSNGRSSCITPAFCITSMFWGRVAASATLCTNCTRAFWYVSKICKSEEDIPADSKKRITNENHKQRLLHEDEMKTSASTQQPKAG